MLTEAFYWDLNDKTRAFSKRFSEKFKGKSPLVLNMIQGRDLAKTLGKQSVALMRNHGVVVAHDSHRQCQPLGLGPVALERAGPTSPPAREAPGGGAAGSARR